MTGLVHGAKSAPSRLHSNVRSRAAVTLSDPVNSNVAVVAVVVELSAGPAVMPVSGFTVSITHVKLAGSWSALPAASDAVTVKVCDPSLRPL